ncbi:hypothetical protein GCM10018782_46170 [Streptomyces griseoaurantiacus]|nr:hypothetical protein GCM10018782_46170 [Streptomyces griseoaurantiacus]
MQDNSQVQTPWRPQAVINNPEGTQRSVQQVSTSLLPVVRPEERVPHPCHNVRSTTVNDGSPQPSHLAELGPGQTGGNLRDSVGPQLRPYKADVGWVPAVPAGLAL